MERKLGAEAVVVPLSPLPHNPELEHFLPTGSQSPIPTDQWVPWLRFLVGRQGQCRKPFCFEMCCDLLVSK